MQVLTVKEATLLFPLLFPFSSTRPFSLRFSVFLSLIVCSRQWESYGGSSRSGGYGGAIQVHAREPGTQPNQHRQHDHHPQLFRPSSLRPRVRYASHSGTSHVSLQMRSAARWICASGCASFREGVFCWSRFCVRCVSQNRQIFCWIMFSILHELSDVSFLLGSLPCLDSVKPLHMDVMLYFFFSPAIFLLFNIIEFPRTMKCPQRQRFAQYLFSCQRCKHLYRSLLHLKSSDLHCLIYESEDMLAKFLVFMLRMVLMMHSILIQVLCFHSKS
jgi:hypothetical protein